MTGNGPRHVAHSELLVPSTSALVSLLVFGTPRLSDRIRVQRELVSVLANMSVRRVRCSADGLRRIGHRRLVTPAPSGRVGAGWQLTNHGHRQALAIDQRLVLEPVRAP